MEKTLRGNGSSGKRKDTMLSSTAKGTLAAPAAPLACEWRGEVLDRLHRGAIVVTDTSGKILDSVGDLEKVNYLRSSAKPFQTIVLIEHGGAECYGLTPAEIAIMCASHSGGAEQVATVRSILAKGGIPEKCLHAGADIRDCCSGKHAGMLLLAKLLRHPLDGYLENQHPVQQMMLLSVAEMCGLGTQSVRVGIDGCGAPTFAVPLRNMAMGYARLANPQALPAVRAKACQTIAAAMQAHPEMVGGLEWQRFTQQDIVAKTGGDCLGAGLLGRGIGLAIKVDDGAGWPLHSACFEMLRRHSWVTADQYNAFATAHPPVVYSRDGKAVGRRDLLF